MLGIALGSFTQGFNQGVETGVRLHDIHKQRKLEKGLEQAEQQGTAEFKKAVAEGKEQEGDFQSTYANYIVPHISQTYMANGDPAKASAFMEWADTNNAKRGTKKFTEGLGKIQQGDVAGGVQDMVSAANLKGYGPDGKVSVAEYFDEEAGAVTGYKFTFEGADGKPQTKSVAAGDVSQFLAGIANPQSAFEMEQESKAAHSKADLEVETHGRKKKLEKELGVGTGAMTEAQYQNAIQEESKQLHDRQLIDPELKDLTGEEIEQMAREAVDARLGKATAAPAGPTVTVDPETGEPVEAAPVSPVPTTPADDAGVATTPSDDALGVQPPAAPDVPVSEAPAPEPEQPTATAAATPAAATAGAPTPDKQAFVAQAAQQMRQGAPVQKIAQSLIQAGVPPEQWPQDLQLAAKNAQLGVG